MQIFNFQPPIAYLLTNRLSVFLVYLAQKQNRSHHNTYTCKQHRLRSPSQNTGLVLGGKRRVQLNLIIKHNNEVE